MKVSTPTVQRVSTIMRWWFVIDTVLVGIAALQLFILSEQTEYFFAWTIRSPLTAAFLGAGYFAAVPMLYLASREEVWANARIAVWGVWILATLNLVMTFLHLDRFHINSPILTAQLAFWAWLVIYAVVPVGLLVGYLIQRREPGSDPPHENIAPVWLRVVLGAQSAVMLILGVAMFLAPDAFIPVWYWSLTPLTARAMGAWFIGIGVAAVQALWELDLRRVTGALVAFAAFGLLQLVNLARYPNEVIWSAALAWAHVLFMLSAVGVGLASLYLYRHSQTRYTPRHEIS